MTSIVGNVLLLGGAMVLVLAAAGLFVFPDALSRQHAATKAGSLGVAMLAAGAGLAGGDLAWIGRAVLIVLVTWATLPVASHVLARAALRTSKDRES